VFNDQWQVVALHHSGIGKKNDAGDYIDKDGKVIPTINGKIDSSKVVWVANEGIRISVILKDLFSNNSDNKIVGGLKIRPELEIFTPELMPANEKELVKGEKLKTLNLESDYPPYCVHISIPASLVEKSGTINIKINPDKQIVKGKKRKKRIQ
jgi:endonuclease G